MHVSILCLRRLYRVLFGMADILMLPNRLVEGEALPAGFGLAMGVI